MNKKHRAALCMGIGLALPLGWAMLRVLLWPHWEDTNTFPDTAGERFHALFYLTWTVAMVVLFVWGEWEALDDDA
jgi:hypothetical protein